MYIEDITEQLKITSENGIAYFCFNHSLINIKDNIFMVTYRVIRYNAHNKDLVITPWKIWWDGYKLISDHNPIVLSKDFNLKLNNKLFLFDRNESVLAIDMFLDLSKTEIINNIDNNLLDYDSTGIAIIRYNLDTYKWEVLYNNNNVFDYQLVQDTRISKANDKLYITYNVFEQVNNKTYVKMKYREILYDNIINDKNQNSFIYLTLEHELLDSIDYKHIEKNCVFDESKNTLYSIGREFKSIVHGSLVVTPMPLYDKLIDLYGGENIHISLGTPGLKYGPNNLAFGHIKFEYKKDYGDTPLGRFLKNLSYENINCHGAYIYMMFAFEYSDKMKVLRVTDFFIPYNPNDPLNFHLVFPSGLTKFKDKYLLSYGEGDCKCKIFGFYGEELEPLLKEVDLIEPEDINFRFLDPKENETKKKILHIGYFNEYNCGDDAFVKAFKYLHYKYYPNYRLSFRTWLNENEKYDMITLGGGDVLNEYFIKTLEKNKTLEVNAVSVGVPYQSYFDKLDRFKSLCIRNSRDLEILQKYYPEKQIVYFPDLAFLLKRFIKLQDYNFDKTRFKIGLCLTRTFFHPKYVSEYISFVKTIVKLINNLLEKGYQIYLIPFGINKTKFKENDIILIKHLKSFFVNDNDVINVTTLDFYDRENYVTITYNLLNNVDFCICSRFHAHIFNTSLGKPFVSYTSSRKCKEYMKEMGLSDLLIEIRTNEIDLPCEYDYNKLITFANEKIDKKEDIEKRIKKLSDEINNKMDNFIDYWQTLIKNNT